MSSPRRTSTRVLFLIAGLATLAYLPALRLPLISDDYIQIWLGRYYGPITRWPALLADPLYRCRFTSILLTHWTELALGISPLVINLSGLVLHILNCWLIFLLGCWRVVGWRASAAAAMCFAVFEGHQEAVVWYAALPELLVFACAVGCAICWTQWIQQSRERPGLYAAAVGLYILALLSKESAVAIPALLLLISLIESVPLRRALAHVLPFMALAGVYFWLSVTGAKENQHYMDGTFSLAAPVWITLPNSLARMFWIWGAVALAALLALRQTDNRRLLVASAGWMCATLLPYSFLTYMNHVPSRHTYLAGLGLAWLLALAALAIWDHWIIRAPLVPALTATIFVGINCGYLWMRKNPQYARRAKPTQDFIMYARESRGAIRVKCFPYTHAVAVRAAQIGAGIQPELVLWDPDAPEQAPQVYCDRTRP